MVVLELYLEALIKRRKKAYYSGLEHSLNLGINMLKSGTTALDVVEAVVRDLEDNPIFNAGLGSVYNAEGKHDMDASIMDGRNLKCGAVAGVITIKNPISLARRVMENTKHVLLIGRGAEEFATKEKVERVPNEYFDTQHRKKAWEDITLEESSKGTVGCCAIDIFGNLASATSTGGLTNKMVGRVGDSAIIGAGTYANNKTCAISGTGDGEEFIRHSVASSISLLME